MKPELTARDPFKERELSIRIVAIYVILSAIWIAFSDRLLVALVSDPALLTNLQTMKGWFFVAATAGILYWLIYRNTAALRGSEDEQRHAERVQAATYQISETANRVDNLQELFQSIHSII